MNTTKQKQTQIYREHNSGCQRGEKHGEEQDWQRRFRGGNCMHKKSQLQGCNVPYREYSQYFIIILYGVKSIKYQIIMLYT